MVKIFFIYIRPVKGGFVSGREGNATFWDILFPCYQWGFAVK